jgi:hypothetical protein
MKDGANTLRLQVRQRHDHIMGRLDVRLVSLIEIKIRTVGTEERGDNEVEFAVRNTTPVSHRFSHIVTTGKLTSVPNNSENLARREYNSTSWLG